MGVGWPKRRIALAGDWDAPLGKPASKGVVEPYGVASVLAPQVDTDEFVSPALPYDTVQLVHNGRREL
jgi:hypothetical protein